jgi:hypothetical protein
MWLKLYKIVTVRKKRALVWRIRLGIEGDEWCNTTHHYPQSNANTFIYQAKTALSSVF